jgi:hypothetical protein
MRRWLPVIGLMATMSLTAGCGSSSTGGSAPIHAGSTDATSTSGVKTNSAAVASSSSGLVKPLSSSQLIASADAICVRLSRELAAAKDTIQSQADIIRIAPHRAASEQTAVEELSKLTPPAAMARGYRQMVVFRRTLAEDITKLGVDAETKNVRSEDAIFTSSASLQAQMRATAESNGFKDCAHL